MQRVAPGIRDTFSSVEKALRKNFVPALFQGLGEGAPERGVTRLPEKTGGTGPSGPNSDAP